MKQENQHFCSSQVLFVKVHLLVLCGHLTSLIVTILNTLTSVTCSRFSLYKQGKRELLSVFYSALLSCHVCHTYYEGIEQAMISAATLLNYCAYYNVTNYPTAQSRIQITHE